MFHPQTFTQGNLEFGGWGGGKGRGGSVARITCLANSQDRDPNPAF